MANLKDLKARIGSVKSTQKITKAMKMVAASKLRRARESAEAAAPYAERMEKVLTTLASSVSDTNAPALLVGNGSDKTHLIVVISSDRGLCGGFNTHLVKAAKTKIESLKADGKIVKILCLGTKGYEQLKNLYASDIIDTVEGLTKAKKISYDDVNAQVDRINKMFVEGEFDVCTIFYNKFISAINQEVTEQQLIPLDLGDVEKTSDTSVYEYEPSEAEILNDLLPENLNVQFYHALLENTASEHGARMTAMDNATRNAGDMIKSLTLVYNRTRQAAITTELIEIIAGAEAV